MQDLFGKPSAQQDFQSSGKPQLVATYKYIDPEGRESEKLRYSDKSFRWRRRDGNGGWIYDRKGITPTLYGTGTEPLPGHVYFVEGEKDADNLRNHNTAAVSPPDGAQSKWNPQFTEALKGKCVAILPDNDKPGRELARKAATELAGQAASVKILDLAQEWPGLPEKGDISDILAATPAEDVFMKLEALEAITPEFKKKDFSDDIWGRTEYQDTQRKPHKLETISAVDLQRKDLPPIRFIVNGLFPQGLALLASPPKYGKSWLVLDLCLSVAAGKPFLKYQTVKSGCLYLALEDSEHRLQDRMNKVLNGEKAPEQFDYATSALDIGHGLIDQLEGYMETHPEAGLIVIDTLQKVRTAASGKENAYSADYKEIGMLKNFADKHGICVLLVHHLRKMSDDTDPFNRISGTNGISGAADTMMVLSKAKRSDAQTTLSVTGRDIESSDTVVEFDKNTYRWQVMGDANWLAEQRAKLEYQSSPIVSTIKNLLEQSPAGWSGTMQELLDAGKHFAHTYLANTPRDLTSKVKALDKLLFDYDHIIHERAKNGNSGGSKHKFYRGFSDTGDDKATTGFKEMPQEDAIEIFS